MTIEEIRESVSPQTLKGMSPEGRMIALLTAQVQLLLMLVDKRPTLTVKK